MAAIEWYGCEKEAETGCGLRVVRDRVSLELVADYLILYGKMKKSVATDHFIC